MQHLKQCESCRKTPAVVRCHKNGGTVYWYYCEPCFKKTITESNTSHISWGRWDTSGTPVRAR